MVLFFFPVGLEIKREVLIGELANLRAAMLAVGVLAGMEFTMARFIAALAFVNPDILATAKLAILLASLLAGMIGFILLRQVPHEDITPINKPHPS